MSAPKFAVVTLGTDGTVSVAGPYASQRRAQGHADRLSVNGHFAAVHWLDTPTAVESRLAAMPMEFDGPDGRTLIATRGTA